MPSNPPTLDLPAPERRALAEEIDATLVELQRLARAGLGREEFYRQLLERAASTVAASWAGVWTTAVKGAALLTHAHGPDAFRGRRGSVRYGLASRAVLQATARRETQVAELPLWSEEGDFSIVAPVVVDADAPTAILTFAYDQPLPPDVATGLTKFIARVAEFAAKYEARTLAQSARDAAAQWQRFVQFTTAIQRDGPLREVAAEVANESARYLQCGRVSVAVRRRGRIKIVAVSGLERFHRAAKGLTLLESLAAAVVRSGRPLYAATLREELPPQLEHPLETYLDEAGARDLAVLPLYEPESDGAAWQKPFGAIICEAFDGQRLRDDETAMGRVLAQSALALSRADRLQSLPLLDRCLRTAHRRSWFAISRIPIWLVFVVVILSAAAALRFMTTELRIETRGVVEPTTLQHVFSPFDAVVDEISVTHGQTVAAGDPLVKLRSPELELQQERLRGEIEIAQREIDVLRAGALLLDGRRVDEGRDVRDRAAREKLLQEKLDNLALQLEIVDKQLAQLKILAPFAGEVLTWELEQTLAGRPVRRGARLMTVADLDGEWRLKLVAPDRSMAHVLQAREESPAPLPINFVLAADPEKTYSAELTRIDTAAHFDESTRENSVYLEAQFDRRELRELRPNATVFASIQCGRASLGYVWFHEVLEEFQRRFF